MPWNQLLGRWVTVLAPRCVGCDQIVWLDDDGRCSDCVLYETGDLVVLPELPAITEEEWDRAFA